MRLPESEKRTAQRLTTVLDAKVWPHTPHCYTYYQDLLRKRELKHYITITLRCVLKRKRTKTIFLKILFFSFTGLLGAFFPVLWLLWKRVYSRWCSQISSTSCLFCSVYGYLSFQYHHCPQSVSMPRSQFSVY